MKRLLLLACLLLAACAPVVVTVPVGDVLLPEQIQRAADAYTATARVEATQAAGATATGASARETATAASQGTLQAVAVEQTRTALQITVAAAAGIATDSAAVKTQAARQTDAWASPTAAAIRTQAATTADETRRQQASAESAAQFWSLLRWVLLGGIAGVVVVVCVLVVMWGIKTIRVEELRQKAAIARDAFRLLSPGHWAEWLPENGYQVYQLPGALDAPPTIVENVITSPSRLHAWRHAVRLFAWWGERYGFGINELAAGGACVVTDPGWRTLSKLLKDAGALAELPKTGQRGRVTQWAVEWDYRRFADELDSGRLVLPFPEKVDAPKVAFAVPTQQEM